MTSKLLFLFIVGLISAYSFASTPLPTPPESDIAYDPNYYVVAINEQDPIYIACRDTALMMILKTENAPILVRGYGETIDNDVNGDVMTRTWGAHIAVSYSFHRKREIFYTGSFLPEKNSCQIQIATRIIQTHVNNFP